MTNTRGLFFREYRCRDCGRDVGVQSRPRTFYERYILPVFLCQPVRCAQCFRRDYRWIFTVVQDRDESFDAAGRKAA